MAEQQHPLAAHAVGPAAEQRGTDELKRRIGGSDYTVDNGVPAEPRDEKDEEWEDDAVTERPDEIDDENRQNWRTLALDAVAHGRSSLTPRRQSIFCTPKRAFATRALARDVLKWLIEYDMSRAEFAPSGPGCTLAVAFPGSR